MKASITAGLVGEKSGLEILKTSLQKCSVGLNIEAADLDAHAKPAVDVLIVNAAHLKESPQLISQKINRLGKLPFLVLIDEFSLEEAKVWSALGAADVVARDDADRIAFVLLQITQAAQEPPASHLLQTVIDAVPTPIFFKDENGAYLGCNRAFEFYVGQSADDLIGKTVYDISPKRFADVYHKADLDLIRDGGAQEYEAKVKYADGSVHDIVFNKAVFYKPDGRKGGVVGAMLDVTERKKLEEKFERWATVDPLTSTYNRRSFFRLAEAEHSRCARERQPLSLMVIDIDHFKNINDTYGHAAGDAVLVNITNTAQKVLRKHDIFARAGGEEFYVTLGNTGLGQADRIARRLSKRIADIEIAYGQHTITVTASIGVTECNLARENIEDALKRADTAMYEAKRHGRNCVISHPLRKAS